MHVTLKTIEKLDDLLDETDEYIKCANAHADDNELKATYLDLARCHFDGYERLSKCAERAVERKAQSGDGIGEGIRQMWGWQKAKFDERAAHLKMRLEQAR